MPLIIMLPEWLITVWHLRFMTTGPNYLITYFILKGAESWIVDYGNAFFPHLKIKDGSGNNPV